MEINYLEERNREVKLSLLFDSLEWHRRSIEYTFMKIITTDEFENAADRLEKIVSALSNFDKDLTEKAGWK